MRDPEIRCLDCDTSDVWFAEVCTSCGTALAGTGLGSSGAIGGPVSSQLPRNPTKTCPICGILNDDLGRFCTSCGAALVGRSIHAPRRDESDPHHRSEDPGGRSREASSLLPSFLPGGLR